MPVAELEPRLRDPLFNLRIVTKDLLCLERHLKDPAQRCPECIVKHALSLEAFTDEAMLLDRDGQHGELLGAVTTAVAELHVALKAAGVGRGPIHRSAALDAALLKTVQLRKELEMLVW